MLTSNKTPVYCGLLIPLSDHSKNNLPLNESIAAFQPPTGGDHGILRLGKLPFGSEGYFLAGAALFEGILFHLCKGIVDSRGPFGCLLVKGIRCDETLIYNISLGEFDWS